MQVLVVKIIFVFTSLLAYGDAAATSSTKNAPAVQLKRICQELNLCTESSPVSFELFGMPAAFIVLNQPETSTQFLRRVHEEKSPFSQFTRVGNQVFYSGWVDGTSLQLVVDLVDQNRTQAILSATTAVPGNINLADGSEGGQTLVRLAARRMLALLPDGARLLMDVCYAERAGTCHQVYVYPKQGMPSLTRALAATLRAARWQELGSTHGLATWRRHGLTLQYFMSADRGATTLYLTAPAILW